MAGGDGSLVFIDIDCSCSEGCGFDFYYRPGSFYRDIIISLYFMARLVHWYLVGSWGPRIGLNSPTSLWIWSWDRVMTLNKLCTYTCALANQAIHPLRVGKLVPQFVGGNNAYLGWKCRIQIAAFNGLDNCFNFQACPSVVGASGTGSLTKKIFH